MPTQGFVLESKPNPNWVIISFDRFNFTITIMIESKLIIQSQLGYSFVNTEVENANSGLCFRVQNESQLRHSFKYI